VLRLDQAHVAGEVTLMGARVGDGTGEAVAAKGITVDGDMQCNRGSPRTAPSTCVQPGSPGG
jgi:hypothetical protein